MSASHTLPKAGGLLYDEQGRIDLKSLSLPELERFTQEALGERPFRARQLWKWLWQKGARTFQEMSDLSGDLRGRLAEKATIAFLEPEIILRSVDGTLKYLWRLQDGQTIESVLIPDGERTTLCMSSQVGCSMGCTFCLTGDLGLRRHLKPSEIANQPLQVGRQLPEGTRITNLVLMGMGEPLHNFENLLTALRICMDDNALNYSHRRITVSTVGLTPKLRELAARLPVNLAVSLNASTEAQRREIMPITKRHSLEELLEACREIKLPAGKRITFEYVLFRDQNDSLEDAARLVKLLHGIKAKVNLIPYNENPDRDLRPPAPARVQAFQNHLMSR
ncbi:MAG: 23S rRNA (adenine(2503)-C(2))-methyltransferase RlmN, partial [Deltaproteobacteria bacterium]|nr:23S rRNA (adenine(2503)-C(2))-methyltransferase RlmN [Deltaproteobacteria bacterium]